MARPRASASEQRRRPGFSLRARPVSTAGDACWVSSRLTPTLRSESAVGSIARLRGEGRQDTGELLGWRAPLQGQGEPFVVVRSLPRSKGSGRLVEVCKPMASPKLLLVDPMAALHLPVLLGPPRPNVAMPDAGRFDRKDEIERKLSAVVALQLADPEGERPLELDQERQAGALMKAWVEAQHPKASPVVQGRVLERPASRNFHILNVHLDAVAGLRLLEELHLPGDPLSRPPKPRDAEIAKNALDRAHGDADVVNAAKPELGSGGAVGELPARLADQLDDPRGHAAATATGIPRDEPLEAPLAPPLGCPSKQRRSISGRYFTRR